MSRHHTVIVGAGIVGAAVFQRLSHDLGGDVLLIEKSRPCHGATGSSGGILRTFHLDLLLARRCHRGVSFFRELARTADNSGLRIHRTGFLTLVDAAHLEAAWAAHETLSPLVELDWLSPAEAASRFGVCCANEVRGAVFEPEAGYVDPVQATRLLLAMGQDQGGVAMSGIELQRLMLRDGALCGIGTNVGFIECERLVLCTGAWTPTLARQLSVRLPVQLRAKTIQVNTFCMHPGAPRMPAFVDLGTQAYGRPDGPSRMLVGSPVDEWDVDPDEMPAPSSQARGDAVAKALPRWNWLTDARAAGGMRRPDAFEASGRGVVDWAEGTKGVLVAAGFSGNGVKLAPAAADGVAGRLHACASGQDAELAE